MWTLGVENPNRFAISGPGDEPWYRATKLSLCLDIDPWVTEMRRDGPGSGRLEMTRSGTSRMGGYKEAYSGVEEVHYDCQSRSIPFAETHTHGDNTQNEMPGPGLVLWNRHYLGDTHPGSPVNVVGCGDGCWTIETGQYP